MKLVTCDFSQDVHSSYNNKMRHFDFLQNVYFYIEI